MIVTKVLIGAAFVTLLACGERPEAGQEAPTVNATLILDGGQRAVGVWPTPETLHITADANVRGPTGTFRTLIYSSADGRVRMEQTPSGFLAGVGESREGWVADLQSGEIRNLGDLRSVVRGHELHMLGLVPRSRLSEPRLLQRATLDSREVLAVALSFPDGDSLVAYFEPEDTLPAGLLITGSEPYIVVRWIDWIKVEGVRVFRRAVFRQGPEEYHYSFDRIEFELLPDSLFQPPS